jgi:hypothetical protein
MLKSVIGGMVLSILVATGAASQQVDIEATISSQIEAFKTDDFEQAFTYATPTLQKLFQTPENFQRMVTGGYPMVWRPAEARYLELTERDGVMWQKVQITDLKGFIHLLLYQMEQTANGWRIAGVQLLRVPRATV